MHHRYQHGRPADLPKGVADALVKLDDVFARAQQAERTARELADKSHDEAAEKADRAAAAKAATEGKDIPAPSAVPTLEADRGKAAAAVVAFTDAVEAAVNVVHAARSAAAEAGESGELTRRTDAVAALLEQAEELAGAITAEHTARQRHTWLRTGVMPQGQAQILPWDAVPGLLGFGVGPGSGHPLREQMTSATDVVRRAVAAAFAEEV